MYLVRNGVGKCTILVRNGDSGPACFAGSELNRYIRKMTGARIKVMHAEPKMPGNLVVLEIKQVKGLAEDGFVIRTKAGQLTITAQRGRALLYGVYHLLETFGCRWFAPGDDVVPERKNISVAGLSVKAEPDFPYRARSPGPAGGVADQVKGIIAQCDWAAKTRVNSLNLYLAWDGIAPSGHGRIPLPMSVYEEMVLPEILKRDIAINTCGHSFMLWLPPDEFLDKHPGYYSLIDGKRRPAQLCMSNAKCADTVASRIMDFLARHPEVGIIDLSPMDGQAWCECAKCRKLDAGGKKIGGGGWFGDNPSTTRSYLHFVNEVAGRVCAKFPEIRFFATAYVQYLDPPVSLKIHDNVCIDLYWYWRCYSHGIEEECCPRNKYYAGIMARWLKKARLVVPEYHYGMGAWNGLPYPILRIMAGDWPAVSRLKGVLGGRSKPGDNPSYILNSYYHSRLLWDVAEGNNLEEILRDFCRNYYAGAAQPAYKYISCLLDALDDVDGYFEPYMLTCLTTLLNPKRIKSLERFAQQMRGKSKDATTRRRVREFLKLHKHTVLCWHTITHMEKAKQYGAEDKPDAAVSEYRAAIRSAEKSLKHQRSRYIVVAMESAKDALGEAFAKTKGSLAEDLSELARSKK